MEGESQGNGSPFLKEEFKAWGRHIRLIKKKFDFYLNTVSLAEKHTAKMNTDQK